MSRFQNVQFLDAAMEDLRHLAARSRPLLVEVFRLLSGLDSGDVVPTPLQDFGKTGDLSDCGKIVVVVSGQPEHRIVVRNLDGQFTVTEVVAVEDRTGDLPYLLAGLRLSRVHDAVRRSDIERRIWRLRQSR